MNKTSSTILIALVIIIVAFWAYKTPPSPTAQISPSPTPIADVPQNITVRGIWECLPHRDTSGPQTMECAFGLATDGGAIHYALDLNNLDNAPIDYATGALLEVTGLMVPIEQLSTDMWRKYDIRGIISVSEIKKI